MPQDPGPLTSVSPVGHIGLAKIDKKHSPSCLSEIKFLFHRQSCTTRPPDMPEDMCTSAACDSRQSADEQAARLSDLAEEQLEKAHQNFEREVRDIQMPAKLTEECAVQGNVAEAQELFRQAIDARQPASAGRGPADAAEPGNWEDEESGECTSVLISLNVLQSRASPTTNLLQRMVYLLSLQKGRLGAPEPPAEQVLIK